MMFLSLAQICKMRFILLSVFIFMLNIGYSQYSYDNCLYAVDLPDTKDYCSKKGEFSNTGATVSSQPKPNCWNDQTDHKDVWFTFTPKSQGASIKVIGKAVGSQETLVQPSISVFQGSCNNMSLVGNLCNADLFNVNLVELNYTEFQIGQTYYIRVAAKNGNEGSFQLCIREFNPKPSPEADCADAVVLCDKQPFIVQNLEGVGKLDQLSGTCIREEYASVWYKWVCDKPGTLTFDITPINTSDDIDFAIFKLPGGINDCANKELVRCMASGETQGNSAAANSPCFGPTGLSLSANDDTENPGCDSGDDNYVRALNMESGEVYVLIVNNFSSTGYGFEMEWGGTGTFLGPEPGFEVKASDRFECDKQINFVNTSKSDADPIVEYSWNFGNSSTPQTADTGDDQVVQYSSFGDKVAAITVKTKRGCVVTEVKEFFIQACCKDTSTLKGGVTATDVICHGEKTGSLLINGSGGVRVYNYQINNGPKQRSPGVSGLGAGTYDVAIIDQKGCVDSLKVTINQPPKLTVEAGKDSTVVLGDSIKLDGSFGPFASGDVLWANEGNGNIKCPTCLDTELTPYTEGQYILTVTNEAGCVESDTLTIRVVAVRDIYAPNVFKPDGNGVNDFFNVFASKSAEKIEELLVYDRWGNLVYKGSPKFNSYTEGWNGEFNGKPVEPGVYAWLVKMLYKDKVVLPHSGNITVIR